MNGRLVRGSILAGGLLGALSVAAGAFGAHGLKRLLESAGQAGNWETASRYALVHALVLVTIGLLAGLPSAKRAGRVLSAAAWCCGVGTLIFSGCLWALAVTGVRMLGAVVPVGGVLLIAAWLLVALGGGRLTADSHGPARHDPDGSGT